MGKRRTPYDEVTTFDWDTFLARWWERRVVVFRGTGASPFVPADVFACAVEASRRQLGETYDVTVRRDAQFSIDGQQQAFVEPWLPVARDGDLAGYAARLGGSLGARRHALVISGFHTHSFALWSRERALFAPLWQRIGLPLTGAITTLFHGDYEATPAGVHKDRFTTFLFALHGRKRMRFWPSRPWTEPVSAISEYGAHLPASFAVDVEPGDILYWPSSHYHVGEGTGGLATSVNVGVPIDEHHATYYVDDLLLGTIDEVDLPESARRRSRLRPGRARPLERTAPGKDGQLSATLPAALRAAVTQFQRLTAPREAERQIRSLWLARQSAAGFEPAPPAARRVRLHDGDRVRGDREQPVWLTPADGDPADRGNRGNRDNRGDRRPPGTRGTPGTRDTRATQATRATDWLCAANGHTVRVIGHPAVPALCAALATGRPRRVGELLRPFAARAPAIRTLLEQLVALRALERVTADH